MANIKKSDKTNDTNKKMNKAKHQIGEKVKTVTLPKKLEDMNIRTPWYRFNEIHDKVWLEIDKKSILTRDPIVEKLSSKFKNLTPWETKDFSDDIDENLMRRSRES